MTKWRERAVVAAVVLGGAALLGGMIARPVWAEIRAAFVRDVDNPALQPLSASSGLVTFAPGSISANVALLSVPAGKRAVVEHFSCINYLASANNFVRFELEYTSNGETERHQFVHTRVGASLVGGIDVWSFSQPVSAYADPGTSMEITAIRRSTAGQGGIECYASGHYVDLP
jgi:hypothetical protein